MTTYEVLSLVAIISGPLAAIFITRWNDKRREDFRRKAEILSTLMKTRAMKLSYEHVGALNTIQLEFYGKERVLSDYRKYMDQLQAAFPKEEAEIKRFLEVRSDLFTDLVHSIAKDLGYSFDKKDLDKLSYGPIGWENDDNAARMLRAMAIDILAGKKPIPVTIRPATLPSDMFPPPPST